ncbi:MAG: hypothetical protein JJU34_07800 [Lunatimonas sp.]|uniref:type I restriction-modification system subunit M N-terminal domain-containing protein n=1 Tax=Lunatimonas sp. TaxID=2060141 RepID=UPI00263B6C08|nr:type I restriction-modification system subunit M N-terminal domain-containing protein [Lunatimonas sp.]MCC5937170.1 hypothetical protein [Lunatimonas sp.]
MTHKDPQPLGITLWDIAENFQGSTPPDDFHNYMLSFLFLGYLSHNYDEAAKKELGEEHPVLDTNDYRTPLAA